MNFYQKIGAIWQNVGVVQRALLIATILAVVLVGGLIAYWAQIPDMKVLYSGLDAEEAGKITDKISEKNIPYKLNNTGTTVYVPKEHVTQLRLDMAKEGLPGNSQKGYGIFDDEKVGVSPFVQNVNLKRALQDELAKSIQMIEGITHARIHIVRPEGTLFNSQKSQTSASVILRLKPGYKLSPLNIAAITHIVTGSIEGLDAKNVTVVDSQGRLLSSKSDQIANGGAETVADYRERVELNLANKVGDMLVAVLGPGRAMVRVSAEIDMTSSNVAKEIYSEGKAVPTKEEITSGSETEAGNAEAAGPKSSKKEETIVTEYAVPKTVEQTVELAGEIQSVTVAVFVDLSPPEYIPVDESEEEKAKVEAAASAGPIMEIDELQEIIKKAIGPKLAEDGLKVVNLKFNRPTEMVVEEEVGGLDYIQIARQSSLGIMAICALIVLKIFSGGKSKIPASDAVNQFAMSGAAGMPAGGMVAGGGDAESLMLRRQIASSLQNNPEGAKQLFANWLQEKGN